MRAHAKYILTVLCMSLIGYAFAQTIPAPDLNCVTKNGQIDSLTWELPVVTCGGSFIAYYILSSTSPTGPFTTIATIPTQSTTSYTSPNGGNTIYYYMLSDFDCPGFTAVPSDTLDNINPTAPEIEYITVVGNGIKIKWADGVDPETFGYVVFHFPDGNTSIDPFNIADVFDTVYIDSAVVPNNNPQAYTLSSMDSCGNRGARNPNIHQTMYLTVADSICNQTAHLDWTPYIGWDQIRNYFIYKNDTLIDSTAVPNFIYNIQGYDSLLAFKIRATDGSGRFHSYSNIVTRTIEPLQPVQSLELLNVTVNNEFVSIEWLPDLDADIAAFKILRGSFSTDPDDTIETLFFSSFVNNVFQFTDSKNLTPADRNYYYRVVSVDSCGNIFPSNVGNTILLQGAPLRELNNLEVELNWNEPELGIGELVTSYVLFREVNNIPVVVDTFDALTLSYIDDISAIRADDGQITYFIKATYELEGFPYISLSNPLGIKPFHKPIFPNAFSPNNDGRNDVFNPVMRFVSEEDYMLRIFVRWGQKVFESSSPQTGWVGTFLNAGKELPQAFYIYRLQYKSLNGELITHHQGNVMLVR